MNTQDELLNKHLPSKDKGYLKLHRKFFDNYLWRQKRVLSKAEAWIDLLQTARFKNEPTKKLIDDRLVEWGRGQLIGSYRFLAKRWNWKSLTKVKNFLKLLEQEGQILTDTEHHLTRITICNYDNYNPDKNNQGSFEEHLKDNDKTHKKQNRKKVNKENKVNKVNYRVYVSLTEEEYTNFINKYGKTDTEKFLDKLDNYKGSTGKKYKSDYRAILSWVVDNVLKDNNGKKEYEKSAKEEFKVVC